MSRARRGQAEYLPLKRQLRLRMTEAERRLWGRIRARQFHGLKFRRQHGIGPFIVDFYCPERAAVIEVDGDSHAEGNQILMDQQRGTYLASLGVRVFRYTNDDIVKNLEGVLEDLSKRLS